MSSRRDSAGAVDVIRYYVAPKQTLRNWWVKGVRLSSDGTEIGNDPRNWIQVKTKSEAKHIAVQLNKELQRLGRYISVRGTKNPGMFGPEAKSRRQAGTAYSPGERPRYRRARAHYRRRSAGLA